LKIWGSNIIDSEQVVLRQIKEPVKQLPKYINLQLSKAHSPSLQRGPAKSPRRDPIISRKPQESSFAINAL